MSILGNLGRSCFLISEVTTNTLLQDLSAARYSGHVEQHESITESRSYSSYSGSRMAPAPPERSVKTSLSNGKFSMTNGDHHNHDVHAMERRDNRSVSSDRGESKWEYMGYGIWENKDSEDDSGSPPPAQRWSAERGVHSVKTNRVQQNYSNSNTGASTATQGKFVISPLNTNIFFCSELDHLMTSLSNFKMDERNVDEPVG